MGIKQKLCKLSTSQVLKCLGIKMAMMDQELPKPAGSRFPDQSGNSGFVPTQNELDKISSAIQDPTFRSMLVDYANQMNIPITGVLTRWKWLRLRPSAASS